MAGGGDGHTLWCIVRLGWTVHGVDRGKESFGSVEIYRPSFPYCSNQEKNLLLMIDTWHDTSSRLQCSALVSSDSKFCIELFRKTDLLSWHLGPTPGHVVEN